MHDEHVFACATDQGVVATAAVEQAVGGPGYQRVIAVAAEQIVDRLSIVHRQGDSADHRRACTQINRDIAADGCRIDRIASRSVIENGALRLTLDRVGEFIGIEVAVVACRIGTEQAQGPVIERDRQAIGRIGHL
ncbi:hypothetical protein D3C85_1498530 [compost metagenome]